MEEIKIPEFKEKIVKNLDSLDEKPKKDFMKIFSVFDKHYILGGFVRDSVLQILYDYEFPLNDLDILIDDNEFDKKIQKFPQKNKSRFGGLKLKYEGFEIDLFGIKNVKFLDNLSDKEKNLENVLKGCDVSTSSFAYDITNNKIYENGAMRDVNKKEINLKYNNKRKAATICRLILHSDKMDFKLGDSAREYIKGNYLENPEKINKEIEEFAEYKNIEHTKDLIYNVIGSITKKRIQ